MANAWRKYQVSQISSPIDGSIMMYERCLLNLRFVKEKYSQFRFSDEEAQKRIIMTEQLVMELRSGLTSEHNYIEEELRELVLKDVETKRGIYDWFLRELQFMRTAKKATEIDNIIGVIENLLEADRLAKKIHAQKNQFGEGNSNDAK